MASPRATRASVQQAVDGPDYNAALAIINGRIADAKGRQSKAGGEASQAWSAIEKLGINKAGAMMFAKINGMEDDEERVDVLRTFSKMCEAAGIDIPQDIVDVAQGIKQEVVPRARKTKAEPAAKPEPKAGPPGDTDLADEPPLKETISGDADDFVRSVGKNKPQLSIVAAAREEATRKLTEKATQTPDALH